MVAEWQLHILFDSLVIGPSHHGKSNGLCPGHDEGIEGANAVGKKGQNFSVQCELVADQTYAPRPYKRTSVFFSMVRPGQELQ